MNLLHFFYHFLKCSDFPGRTENNQNISGIQMMFPFTQGKMQVFTQFLVDYTNQDQIMSFIQPQFAGSGIFQDGS